MVKVWSEKELKILKQEWGNGLSAKQIGLLINKTKNAVIGKANRLGLSKATLKKPHLAVVPSKKQKSKKEGCQYPIGDYPYDYCGKPTVAGLSTVVYCKKHYTICYQKRVAFKPVGLRVGPQFNVRSWKSTGFLNRPKDIQ